MKPPTNSIQPKLSSPSLSAAVLCPSQDPGGWWERGYLLTEPWALDSRMERMGHRTVWVRQPKVPRLYDRPGDSWRQIWARARDSLCRESSYKWRESTLEVWTEHEDGSAIEASTERESWPHLGEELRWRPRVTLGLVALRTTEAGQEGYPGLNVVLETTAAGERGARLLIEQASRRGLAGCRTGRKEGGRWFVLQLIYPPHWYAARKERLFGIDWLCWRQAPSNDNESKRLWCENAVLFLAEMMRDIPSLRRCRSVFFDEYAASDRLGLLPKPILDELCEVSADDLPTELVRLNRQPMLSFWPDSDPYEELLALEKSRRLATVLKLLSRQRA